MKNININVLYVLNYASMGVRANMALTGGGAYIRPKISKPKEGTSDKSQMVFDLQNYFLPMSFSDQFNGNVTGVKF